MFRIWEIGVYDRNNGERQTCVKSPFPPPLLHRVPVTDSHNRLRPWPQPKGETLHPRTCFPLHKPHGNSGMSRRAYAPGFLSAFML